MTEFLLVFNTQVLRVGWLVGWLVGGGLNLLHLTFEIFLGSGAENPKLDIFGKSQNSPFRAVPLSK